MSFGSFSAGLSGLNANSTYLNVIGNNLANINTVGFKASTVTFMDLVSQTVQGAGANPMQVGLGVVPGSISGVFSQGAIDNTRESTNVAIQGNGFFVAHGSNGGTMYTRAGNFTLDNQGYLVTPDGSKVQGYTQINPLTGAVVTTGQPTDVRIPPGVLQAPVATTQFQALTNLNSSSAVGATFTTSMQVFDALGAGHLATITYTNTAPGAWNYDVSVPGAEVAGGTPGTPFSLTSGTLTFGANGQLATMNGGAPADVAITTPAWSNGAAASALNWDVVDAAGAGYLTGYSTTSATSTMNQNGSAAGMVTGISIGADGTILAALSAGQTVAVGQLALANFTNPKGLAKAGSNFYVETPASGLANTGLAGTGGRGSLIGGALEQSNVDVAQEFTQMILAQRGYQANSKSITVADELMVDTLSLKR